MSTSHRPPATGQRALTVTEPGTLLAYLLEHVPGKGRNKVKALLTHRQVAVDGVIVTRHDHPLTAGQEVSIRDAGGGSADALRGIRILHEDADLIVIDKPPGLLSIATEEERERTAYHVMTDHVQKAHPRNRVFIVHRLDKETSGVMMFAKSEAVQQALQNTWKDTVLERVYTVVVEGRLAKPEGTITSWLKESQTRTMYVSTRPGDGLKAVTRYRVMQAGDTCSLLEVHLETGRKNQIRVQMQSIGHSVVGDTRYGSKTNPLGRLGLHASILSFRHPVGGETLRFDTGIPASFRAAVHRS